MAAAVGDNRTRVDAHNRRPMTSPLKPPLAGRTVRYLQRHGIRRSLRRVYDEFAGRVRPAQGRRPPSLPSAGIAEVKPSAIHASLDAPAEGAIESSSALVIAGWACSADAVTRIDVYVDGTLAGSARPGHLRPDVAEYLPSIAGAGNSGFDADIGVGDLSHGTHMLELVVEDGAGHRRVLSAAFQTLESSVLYHAHLEADKPSQTRMNDLVEQARTAGGPAVHVWIVGGGAVVEGGGTLAATLGSLLTQKYPHWRCTLLVGSADLEAAWQAVRGAAGDLHERFAVADIRAIADEPAQPAAYSGFLWAGEMLADEALLLLGEAGRRREADIVYADHDEIDAAGQRGQPWFNPDWSPDYLLARDYVGGFYLLRDDLRHEFAAAADFSSSAGRYDLLLRATDEPRVVAHLPHVVWSRPDPNPRNEELAGAELDAVRATLERRALVASVEATDLPGTRRLRWSTEPNPLVSIIVPTTGNMRYVEPFVASLPTTAYTNYELLIIDNGRGRHRDGIELLRSNGARILERDEDFNWAKLNNDAAREARGELLLFLNDDIEVAEPGWLDELVAFAQRPDIGAVGGLLLYPDGLIQHAGVFFVPHGGGAKHLLQGVDLEARIYLDLHAVQREVAAVTGACLMIKRSEFERLDGFDERLAIAGNDVDLCLRLLSGGLRNIWTPYCRLIHHESATRRDANIAADETMMWRLWGDFLRSGDPYHSPHLAKDRVDLALDTTHIKVESRRASSAANGVNLIGYIQAEMGVGQATRGTAAALDAAGVPFVILDYRLGNPSRMADNSWARWVADRPAHNVNVAYINADLTPEAFGRMRPEIFDGRYSIGNWTWELPEFPDDWLGSFDYVDEVWTPSIFVQQAIAAKSPVPVLRVPHAIDVPGGPFLDRAALGLPHDAFVFLMMYDFYSIRQRKNPEGAIDAFTRAFEADATDVALVIKMNNVDARERALLQAMVGDRPNIQFIDGTLDRHAVDSLVAAADCFVSLHRSEGFGLAIAEAMGLGKPVIATHWSGNADFMTQRNAACVDYELVELAEDYGPYRAGGHWAEPDIDHAAGWMRTLAGDAEQRDRMGAAARETIARDYSPAAVGSFIAQRLGRIDLGRATRGRR